MPFKNIIYGKTINSSWHVCVYIILHVRYIWNRVYTSESCLFNKTRGENYLNRLTLWRVIYFEAKLNWQVKSKRGLESIQINKREKV